MRIIKDCQLRINKLKSFYEILEYANKWALFPLLVCLIKTWCDDVIVFVLSYYILLCYILLLSLRNVFLSNNRQKGTGSRWKESWEGIGKSKGLTYNLGDKCTCCVSLVRCIWSQNLYGRRRELIPQCCSQTSTWTLKLK